MSSILQFLQPPVRAIRKAQSGRTIARLCQHEDEVLRALGQALQETRSGELTPAESEWVAKIEALREELNRSTVEIAKMDYGAGSPGDRLSAQQMDRGVETTETVGKVCQRASRPRLWSVMLMKLVRKFRPVSCVELGTCLGISASFQAAALKLNAAGKLTTLEGSESLVELAKGHFASLGLDNVQVVAGRFKDTLGGVLRDCGTVDYAFIDGHHDEAATVEYFQQILPFAAARTVLVFDDISWSEGMGRAWRHIRQHEKISVSADLGGMGVCVVDSKQSARNAFDLTLE